MVRRKEGRQVVDLLFILLAAAFFAVSIAYVEGCHRLEGGTR